MIHIELGLCHKGDQGGSPRLEPNRCAWSFPTTNHNPGVKKTWWIWAHRGYMSSYCYPEENQRRTHTHILSTVHWTSICLTPDTFHSDSASCPTRAAPLLETFHRSLFSQNMEKSQTAAAMRSQSSAQEVLQFITLHWTKISPCIQTQTAETAAIQCNHLNYYQRVFFVLCPWPLPLLILTLGRGHDGGWQARRIRVPVRRDLSPCYPKALEELYSPRSQTIISQTLHAYVPMRLSTSVTPHEQLQYVNTHHVWDICLHTHIIWTELCNQK